MEKHEFKNIFKVVDESEDFILLEVLPNNPNDSRRTYLTMLGFDGRETFIRIMKTKSHGRNAIRAVTFWWYGRMPENTMTFTFGPGYAGPRPVEMYAVKALCTALEDLGCGKFEILE